MLGILLATGTVVAVKVRHPGVDAAIRRDFSLMLLAAQAVSLLPGLSSLRLQDSLQQFSAPLREQAWYSAIIQKLRMSVHM